MESISCRPVVQSSGFPVQARHLGLEPDARVCERKGRAQETATDLPYFDTLQLLHRFLVSAFADGRLSLCVCLPDLVCHVCVELVVGVLDAPAAAEIFDVAAPVPSDDPRFGGG
jgi:hypothetical protein